MTWYAKNIELRARTHRVRSVKAMSWRFDKVGTSSIERLILLEVLLNLLPVMSLGKS